MMKQVDMRDLKFLGYCSHEGSNPSGGTMKNYIIEYRNNIIRLGIGIESSNIRNSYRFKSIKDMLNILILCRLKDSDSSLHARGMLGMINEWRVHNLLYSLGIAKKRTVSLDIEAKQPWYLKLLYGIISPFYLHFT